MPTLPRPLWLLCVLAAIHSQPLSAQQIPDAGQLLQGLSPQAPLPAGQITLPTVSTSPPPAAAGGPTVVVREVLFSGNTLVGTADLEAAISGYLGQPLDMKGLQSLVARIQEHYRLKGYPFVYVNLPPQNLAAGKLQVRIIEARYDRVQVLGEEAVVKHASPYLAALAPGEPVRADRLERSLLLLADLPGVKVDPILLPGERPGTSSLEVAVQMTPVNRYELSLDNHGNRYAGAMRAQVSVQADSPFTFGDRLQGRLYYTEEGMWFGSAAYDLPLTGSGWRGRLGLAHTNYDLGDVFAALGANGTADVVYLGLSHPLMRSGQRSLYLTADFVYKKMRDDFDATGLTQRKHSVALPLTLSLAQQDARAHTLASFTLTGGHIHYDAGLTAADVASNAGRRGHFVKLGWDINHRRGLAGALWLNLRFAGQVARENLDSSEKFTLGGASGVRAYPQGEGNGDNAWLAQLELTHKAAAGVTPVLFYDQGEVWFNAQADRIIPPVHNNTRSLAGAGAGLRWSGKNLGMNVTAAWRTRGGAPTSDPRDRHPRLWWSLSYLF